MRIPWRNSCSWRGRLNGAKEGATYADTSVAMARFRFSLERLLRLRIQQVQQAQSTLQYLVASRRALEAHLEQLRCEQEAVQARAARPGIVLAQHFHDLWAYAQRLQQQLETQHQECARLRQLEAAQQHQVREALRAKNILERLREHRWAAFQKAAAVQEQRLLDEVSQRHHQP